MTEVSQADREAAAEYVVANFGGRYRASVLSGAGWPQLSEAFARHAAQARREALREAAGIADTLGVGSNEIAPVIPRQAAIRDAILSLNGAGQ